MTVRHRAPAAYLAIAALLVLCLVAIACVPPTVAPTGSPGASVSTRPTPSPVSTGPTPSPSFVRPTPTPMPTFYVYTVVAGDNLLSIARTFRTTGRSIAYWNRVTYPSLDPDSPTYSPNRIEIGWKLQLIPGVILDPQSLPDASPGSASPTPTPPPPGVVPIVTPAPGAGAIVVSHGSSDRTRVALTFDVSGPLDSATALAGWLIDNNVKATFFVSGTAGTETTIGQRVLQGAALRPDLIDIGNLTWDEPSLIDLDAAAIADQLRRTEAGIGGQANVTTKPWLRPPGGIWDEDVRKAVGAAGWAYLVLWDIDANDGRPFDDGGPSAFDIEARVVSRAESGSIVRLHLGNTTTLEALPAIVEDLRIKGMELVTLTELLVR